MYTSKIRALHYTTLQDSFYWLFLETDQRWLTTTIRDTLTLRAPVTHRIRRHKLAGVDVAVETGWEGIILINYTFTRSHSCRSTLWYSISILLINYYHDSSTTDPNKNKKIKKNNKSVYWTYITAKLQDCVLIIVYKGMNYNPTKHLNELKWQSI